VTECARDGHRRRRICRRHFLPCKIRVKKAELTLREKAAAATPVPGVADLLKEFLVVGTTEEGHTDAKWPGASDGRRIQTAFCERYRSDALIGTCFVFVFFAGVFGIVSKRRLGERLARWNLRANGEFGS
jgi:hypothetical protein